MSSRNRPDIDSIKIPERDRRMLSDRGFDYGSCIGNGSHGLVFDGTCGVKAAHNIPISKKEYEKELAKDPKSPRYSKEWKQHYWLYTKSVTLNGKCCVMRAVERTPQLDELFPSLMVKLRHLHNEHISKVFDVMVGERHIYVVVEYLRCGTLTEFLAELKKPVDDYTAVMIMDYIADGVQYLHFEGIGHGNLAIHNIIFQHDMVRTTRKYILTPKVADIPFAAPSRGVHQKDVRDMANIFEQIYDKSDLQNNEQISGPLQELLHRIKSGSVTASEVYEVLNGLLSQLSPPAYQDCFLSRLARFYISG